MLSSRQTLAVALTVSILGTVVVAWATTRWWWLNQPLSPEVRSLRVATVLEAAASMRDGQTMEEVESALGIDLRPDEGPPEGPPTGPPPKTGLFVRTPYRATWRRVPDPDGIVWEREGPEREVAAWAGDRWIILHNDAVPPGVGLLGLLLLGCAPLVLAGVSLSGRALTPVEAAEDALRRMESGQLGEVLDECSGPLELRRMATAINAMARQTERLVQRERERMAGLSHEMRTPLTRARLELELARRSGGQGERIERIEAELERLDGLVAELLELARLEGGRRTLSTETVDLRGLVEALLDDMEESGVLVRGDGFAEADPRLLRRAVANLVRNARQHAPGAELEVTVGGGWIEVRDDGPGVSTADLGHLFDVFWRGPGTAGDGHGLGLAIVQEIAQAHGGGVQASTDGGLRVRVTIGGSP